MSEYYNSKCLPLNEPFICEFEIAPFGSMIGVARALTMSCPYRSTHNCNLCKYKNFCFSLLETFKTALSTLSDNDRKRLNELVTRLSFQNTIYYNYTKELSDIYDEQK